MKKILITGAGGQDGILLARYLAQESGLEIHGTVRGSRELAGFHHLHRGDLRDEKFVANLSEQGFSEIYHLAGESYAGEGVATMRSIYESNILGTELLLEKVATNSPASRVFIAGSAAMFGNPFESPQNEQTSLNPESPYALSKAVAYKIGRIYRDLGIFVSCGILYNHESVLRPEKFVVRKITKGVARIAAGKESHLRLGALDVVRDWGSAEDFVRGFVMALRHKEPKDFVFATGIGRRVENLCEMAFCMAGMDYREYVVTSQEFIRSQEVCSLVGDPSHASKVLGWKPEISIEEVVREMLEKDFKDVEICLPTD